MEKKMTQCECVALSFKIYPERFFIVSSSSVRLLSLSLMPGKSVWSPLEKCTVISIFQATGGSLSLLQ